MPGPFSVPPFVTFTKIRWMPDSVPVAIRNVKQADDFKLRQHLTLDMPAIPPGTIWLHACSVGEVASVAPLVESLLDRGLDTHITVVTRTGMQQARRLFADRVSLGYLPWDLPGLFRKYVKHLAPRMLLLTETEFWPGMLAACRRRNIPVIGINSRISDRSYPRYRATRLLWKQWLADVQLFLAQSRTDADRLAGIGVEPSRIQVAGNLKYAVLPPNVDAEALRRKLDASQSRPIILAASTHAGEEEQLLANWTAWRSIAPDFLFVLVPRHPERFDEACRLACRHGLKVSRWTDNAQERADAVIIDAMGILRQLYTIADIAIVGGSLVNIGGHNPLEAAICGRGVLTGPHIQNFREVMQHMQNAGAAVVCSDAGQLDQTVRRFLKHPDQLRELHASATVFMQEKTGVLNHVLSAIDPFLDRE
jgi:3-deoxy-D-manno-octulosonic-acid transferase